MEKQLLLFILTLYSAGAFAQNSGNIQGKVEDATGKPVEFATVLLLQAQDSSLVNGAISDAAGNFAFENIKYGKYSVKVKMLGTKEAVSPAFELTESNKNISLQTLTLLEDEKVLGEVVVEAQRPLIEQQIDRMVVNVEGSILASGGTALEILQKSPGITIDGNDNISMKGRQGVMVMIDGKQTYLSSQELANLLRSMSAEAIDKIELITNPSAKYDAAGTSGIINIKTKKNKSYGTNGSITAGAGYGRWEKANAGLSLNHRNQNVNLFGNFDYRYTRGYGQTVTIDRYSFTPTDTSIFNVNNYRPYRLTTPMFRAGADWYLGDKTTVGALVSGNFYLLHRDMISTTRVTTPRGEEVLALDSYNNAFFSNNSLTYNLNFRHEFAREGQELTFDADYSQFKGENTDRLNNLFYLQTARGGAADSVLNMDSNFNTEISIKVAKIDYVHPLGDKWGTVETGAKSSLVGTESNVLFHIREEEKWIKDQRRSNHFLYEENINAAYVNWKGKLGEYSLQLGLRGEQTVYRGESVTLDSVFRSNYLKLFPSLFVNRKLNDLHQLNFSYSRRIGRPSYQSLNPFVIYRDIYNYSQGNPLLQPQFTNEFELRHTFKDVYNTSFGYSRTTNAMTYVPEEDPETRASVGIVRNLQSFTNFNLSFNAPLTIAKWWEVQNNLSAYYNRLEGSYLGQQISNSQFSYNANINNRFTLPAGFTAELSAVYNSPAVYGVLRAKSEFALNAGVQRNFWDKKATLRFNVSDVLNTLRYVEVFDYERIQFTTRQTWESRRAILTFTYRFGNKEVKAERRRRTGSEEERSRIGNGG
ncbi:TonB-dependent receptor [Flammeovirgaceae bacterium 311]|nr:TonB-dependent receptor [Flammeovirgaceae bacterium 311]